MHRYLTSRYLYVPKHGSPNTELLESSSQLAWSLQLPCTIPREFPALQLVVRILGWGHVWPSCLPYEASSTLIFLPSLQLMAALLPSQMVTAGTRMHWYWTCRYLNVPTHGSPNTELLESSSQLAWLSQLLCTTARELPAWQLVVWILGWGHVCPSCLP